MNINEALQLALKHQQTGNLKQAEFIYKEILKVQPNDANALHFLGIICYQRKEYDSAITYIKKALLLNPNISDAYYNLGVIFKDNGQPDEAITCYQKALQLNPNYADAYSNLGSALFEKGQFDEAITYYQKALQLNPNDACAHNDFSLALLYSGNLKEGWKEYEWRLKTEKFISKWRNFSQPLWDGSSLKGKTLFVQAEQGIGDEIMFASCLEEVINQADLCIVECDERLVPLFARSFLKAMVIKHISSKDTYPTDLPPVDMRISIGSLPSFLRPNLSSFPQKKSYLISDVHKVEYWRNRIAELGKGLKIGISWRGGITPLVIRRRSIVLEQWSKLFSIPGIHFINLQYGDCKDELAEAKEKLGITIHDWEDADPLKDLDGFAAQISALDMVISVDNSTVHMAGALGVPVWVLLPFVCDWRWMRKIDDTPWYTTVRLFRQTSLGDWDGVFEHVYIGRNTPETSIVVIIATPENAPDTPE